MQSTFSDKSNSLWCNDKQNSLWSRLLLINIMFDHQGRTDCNLGPRAKSVTDPLTHFT